MIVEFLVACFLMTNADVKQVMVELLASILEVNGNDFEENAVEEMIILRHWRAKDGTEDSTGAQSKFTVIGFALKLPEETESPDSVVDEFAKGMADLEQGFHVLRFEDPLLQAKLAEYSDVIFNLEMKLRRVLSIIYLHAYPNRDPYDLLRMANVNIQGTPTEEDMKVASENQFFHILFSDYIRVNDRNRLNLEDVRKLIQESELYEELHSEMVRTLRQMIDDQRDVELIDDIRRNLDPIENMRNCVAHNRRPTLNVIENYHDARDRLDKRLDDYLAEWGV